jgi:hypothetical protein
LPSSLFLKIFLWFGGVVLTVILGTFLVGELMRPERSEQRTRKPLDPILSVYGKDAAEEYERGGPIALNAYLENAQRQSNLRLFVFDNQLGELSGRRIAANAPNVARKVFETRLPEYDSRGRAALLGRPVRTDSGQQYVLVAELPPPPESWNLQPNFKLAAIINIGGVLC